MLTTTSESSASAGELLSIGDVSIRAQVRALRRDTVSVQEFAGMVVYAHGDPTRGWARSIRPILKSQ